MVATGPKLQLRIACQTAEIKMRLFYATIFYSYQTILCLCMQFHGVPREELFRRLHFILKLLGLGSSVEVLQMRQDNEVCMLEHNEHFLLLVIDIDPTFAAHWMSPI